MQPDFWHQRWRDNRIGFHQDRVTPLLERHWDTTGLPRDAKVFVPLCGKTLDMPWLAARGHRVLGVELSELAVRQFFDEQQLAPAVHASRHGTHYTAGPFELIVGDVFGLDAEALSGCTGVYDRAALIALPPDLRRRYAAGPYARLPARCRGLMVVIDYPQHEKDGPPFSVGDDEVHSLFAAGWSIDPVERRDILQEQPGFAAEGVTALHTTAYRLQRITGA